MNLEQTINLKNRIISGEISITDAKELYFADSSQKSWHTKDWKERRDKAIKDNCEICGSTEILTLQHRSHPDKYFEYEKEVARKYTALYIDANCIEQHELLAHVKNNFDYIPVDLCPNCKSRHPNKRMRKTPQYLCTGCRLEFDTPIHKSVEEIVADLYNSLASGQVSEKHPQDGLGGGVSGD